MIDEAELVITVLDDLNRKGVIKSWSRAMKFIPGDEASSTIDVYEITFGPEADASDIEGIEAFLLRHGRTGNGHEVEVRVLGRGDPPGTFHS
jgi:hypothetical protein